MRIQSLENCVGTAKHNYNKALRAAHNSLVKEGAGQAWTTGINNAVTNYMRAVDKCTESFYGCCNGGI